MSLRIVRYVLSSILATLVTTALFTAASAQEATQEPEPGTFIIQLVDFAPESPLEVRARTERGRITATVDGVECTSVDASTPNPDGSSLGT